MGDTLRDSSIGNARPADRASAGDARGESADATSGRAKRPRYDLRAVERSEVLSLFEEHHGYGSLSNSNTYLFAVIESDNPVAAYAWQPPPPGAAKSACPEAPQGVLSLSRMVALPKDQRRLKHISKPLKRQMRQLIDRTRWPVLITYHDEGQLNADGDPHNGFVYECSGWTATVRSKRPVNENSDGARCSSYSNGRHNSRDLVRAGLTWIQRWENRICPKGEALAWMTGHGWRRVIVPGRTWTNGKQAYTYVRQLEAV
jgi:hypothetical protein